MNKSHRTGLLLGLLIPVVIWAANAALPFTFSSGGAIRASEVNANFTALRDAINAGSSGSRLKVIALRGADGFTQEVPWNSQMPLWDSQLQISCHPSRGQCLPVYVAGLYFSDSSCATTVAGRDGNTADDVIRALSESGADAGILEQPRFAYQASSSAVTFFRLGGLYSGPTFSVTSVGLADGGSMQRCDPVNQGGTFYTTAGIEPASTFASFDVVLR